MWRRVVLTAVLLTVALAVLTGIVYPLVVTGIGRATMSYRSNGSYIEKNGKLVGLLSSFYETERILRDPAAKDKLGVPPEEHLDALVPRNGFRYSGGGGRRFDMTPSVSPTNVLIESPGKNTREDLLRRVQNGMYIGRIWYTYPINGLRAGDFTATVVGDSFVIKDGKLAAPIKANTVRINDNIHNVLRNITGITDKGKGTIAWAADEVVYAPEIAVSRLTLNAIAGYMESL